MYQTAWNVIADTAEPSKLSLSKLQSTAVANRTGSSEKRWKTLDPRAMQLRLATWTDSILLKVYIWRGSSFRSMFSEEVLWNFQCYFSAFLHRFQILHSKDILSSTVKYCRGFWNIVILIFIPRCVCTGVNWRRLLVVFVSPTLASYLHVCDRETRIFHH